MFRREANETTAEDRKLESDFAKLGLPVLTVPEGLQRELEAIGIKALAEDLRGSHREYHRENWKQLDEE